MLSTCKECLDDYDPEDLNEFMVCYVCDHEHNAECDDPCNVSGIVYNSIIKQGEING
jgi:hypothetical protein